MEALSELNFAEKVISQTITKSIQNDLNLDQVAAHCRRDHLNPSFYQVSSNSCYNLSYTPNKLLPKYSQTEAEKGLQQFRKHQNSKSHLPTIIPTILQGSQYQKQFNGQSGQKLQKGKQRETYFLKMNWALDPSSNYQKDYRNRDAFSYNKFNAERPDKNQIHLLNLQEQAKPDTNYKNDFKAINIKKEALLSIGAKDHLNVKENYNAEPTISEYQRRYDSLMQKVRPKDTLLSIYKKETIARNPKAKV